MDGMEVVGLAADGQEAATLAKSLAADVVLMDLRMPGVDGVEGTSRIRAVRPEAAVLILTTFEDDQAARDALAAGALGYVLKDLPPSDLADAIRAVAAGSALIAPALARRLALRQEQTPGEQLTAREQQILSLVADGLSNREIAEQLFLTEGTVKNHLSHVFQKVSARRRTEALARARELGWLPSDRQ
jgi:DNA-binding NarL/FixJ family response regulator